MKIRAIDKKLKTYTKLIPGSNKIGSELKAGVYVLYLSFIII